MKHYIPKKIPEGINTSNKHPLIQSFEFLLPASVVIGGLLFIIHLVISQIVDHISPEKEIELYHKYNFLKFNIHSSYIVPEVPKNLVHFVNELWNPYVSTSNLRPSLNIINTPTENAYMLFGGQMLLTKDIIKNAKYENELAMVICHELGHFYKRHIINQMSQKIVWSIIDFFLSFSYSTMTVNQSINFFADQNFRRDQETEADQFGLDCLHKKYGHVNGSKLFFQRISQKQQKNSFVGQIPEFLSTHPHPQNRIEDLENYSKEKAYSQDGPLVPNNFKILK